MKSILLNEGQGKYKIYFHALFCGKDISISVFGGDLAHIGAVAVGVPRKSLTGDGSNSSSASVICITGHKEDLIARDLALKISSKYLCNTSVSVGIHIDNGKKNDFMIIDKNVKNLIDRFIDWAENELNI